MSMQTVIYRCPHCNQPVDVDVQAENEVLVCPNPNCRKPFRLDIPKAHPIDEPPCPPEPAAAPAQAAPPVAAAPPATKDVQEETVQLVRLSMFRRYPFRCLAYLLLIAAAVIGTIRFWLEDWPWVALVCLGAAGIVAFRLVAWWLRMQNTTFLITNMRCVLESGVFNHQLIEVPLSEIEDIQVRQSLLNKLLNAGDLILLSKHDKTQRIVVMAVPSPTVVAARIRGLQPA